MSTVKVPVFRFRQKGLWFSIGVMRAGDLLEIWDVAHFKGEELQDGYQRERYDERCREIAAYLETSPIPMIPAILLSPRGAVYQGDEEGMGTLELRREPRSVYVVDGQHRIGGFAEILRQIQEEERDDLTPLLDFPVPTVFLDVEASLETLRQEQPGAVDIKGEDLEKALFFIQNETAKKIRPSLRDILAYRIVKAGFRFPAIKTRGEWRPEGTRIVHALNKMAPLKGMINIADIRGLNRPVHLSSFVTSLKPLLTNPGFFSGTSPLTEEDRVEFCRQYWEVVRDMWPEAFGPALKSYLILRALGVYALNYLANDVFNWITSKGGLALPTKAQVASYLRFLAGFNWERTTSPLAGLGGLAGVKRAHKALLQYMHDKGLPEAGDALKTYYEG